MSTHFLVARFLAQTTQPDTVDRITGIVMLIVAVLALVAMVWRRVWKPTAILGPRRVQGIADVLALAFSFFAGAVVWLGLPAIYFAFQMQGKPPSTNPAPIDLSKLSAGQLALLTAVPAVIAALALVCGDLLLRPKFPDDLGYDFRKIPRGLLTGFLAFLVIVPIMFWASVAVEWLYERVGYRHPNEVDLMRAMNEPGLSRLLLIVGATILAPIFEELFFRAHLQTIVRGFLFWAAEMFLPPAPPLPPSFVPDAGFSGVLPYASPTTPRAELPWFVRVILAWVAILFASTFFALLHEGWSEPMIFVLAICLGYVYERTGNLWACITIHALFNICETAMYFGGR